MARNGGLSHQNLGPVMSSCGVRIAGENVGWNTSSSASSMFAMFMASPSHASNILESRFRSVGIGAYHDSSGRWWLTQDFIG
jgi:uncharacterized protein YkwD